MKNKNFNKGIVLTALGSFWWGFFGVIYFKLISFVGHIEVVIHRSFWTTITLLMTTFFFSKWKIFFNLINNKKKILVLLISGFLIFTNWAVWIYAISSNRIIDASFGYFIMPIISIFLGYFFLMPIKNYRKKHFKHHYHLGTELDPELSYAKVAEGCGLKGVKVHTQKELTAALTDACSAQKDGITTFIEVILNQELGEPFRRDAMKAPVAVAGINPEDMRPQQSV